MTSVVKYFKHERFWYYTGIGSSIVSLTTALSFLSILKTEFLAGVAYTFIGVSILELIICVMMLLKTTGDTNRVNHIIQNQPERIRIDEFPRVRKVLRNLMAVKLLTILLAMAGLYMFLSAKVNSISAGIGMGSFIQAILIYGVDHFALKGELLYWAFLQSTYRFYQTGLGFTFPTEHTR